MKAFLIALLALISILPAQEVVPPEKCGACHSDVYDAWTLSRHANSTPLKNPLFSALYNKSIKDTDGGTKHFCIRCHAPVSTLNGDKDLKLEVTNEGVTCQICHTAIELSTHPNSWPLKYGSPEQIMTSSATREGLFHSINNSALFENSQICFTCHGEMIDIPGLTSCGNLPICNQAGEWERSNLQEDCVSCHMPNKDSHSFPGAYSEETLKNSVTLSPEWKIVSGEIVLDLKIKNKTGHRFPSGPPARIGILKISAKDENGREIWTNFKSNPVQEDPYGLFHVILGTLDDLTPAMPWNAKRVIKDTRLNPAEIRDITYKIPAVGIKEIDIKILYRLAPENLLKNFGIEDPQYTKSQIVASTTLTL